MMLEATYKKLREAQFFLRHLERVNRAARTEPEAFEFYLSAFLAATRSVFSVLKKEAGDKPEYWDWVNKVWLKTRTEEEQKLYSLMTSQRNAESHDTGGERLPTLDWIPITRLSPEEIGGTIHWSGPVGVEPPSTRRTTWYFKDDQRELEVLSTCRRYTDMLPEFIESYIKAHLS